MNKVIEIGRLTKDPELRYSANNNTAITAFTIAVNRIKKGEADFINCKSFGKTAELISQYFKKGEKICIEGRIQTGKYEKDGTKFYTFEVIVEKFEFLSSKKDSVNKKTETVDLDDVDDIETDLPF